MIIFSKVRISMLWFVQDRIRFRQSILRLDMSREATYFMWFLKRMGWKFDSDCVCRQLIWLKRCTFWLSSTPLSMTDDENVRLTRFRCKITSKERTIFTLKQAPTYWLNKCTNIILRWSFLTRPSFDLFLCSISTHFFT